MERPVGSSKLVFGVTRILPQLPQDEYQSRNTLIYTFMEAFEALRRQCPKGDIILNLRVEVDKPEDAGVDMTDWEPPVERPNGR
jgi:hypothetical protein